MVHFVLYSQGHFLIISFNIYPYIVGDYAAGMLRFKGFSEKTQNRIPDYLIESCTPNCAYYILKNPNFNAYLDRRE